jgi:hypothetical protein
MALSLPLTLPSSLPVTPCLPPPAAYLVLSGSVLPAAVLGQLLMRTQVATLYKALTDSALGSSVIGGGYDGGSASVAAGCAGTVYSPGAACAATCLCPLLLSSTLVVPALRRCKCLSHHPLSLTCTSIVSQCEATLDGALSLAPPPPALLLLLICPSSLVLSSSPPPLHACSPRPCRRPAAGHLRRGPESGQGGRRGAGGAAHPSHPRTSGGAACAAHPSHERGGARGLHWAGGRSRQRRR